MVATISGTTIDMMMLGFFLAFLAVGDPAGISLLGNVGQTGIVRWELAVEMVDRVPEMLWDALFNRDVFSSGHDLVCGIPYLLSRDNYHQLG